jgi:dipeptide/tripeptide permease
LCKHDVIYIYTYIVKNIYKHDVIFINIYNIHIHEGTPHWVEVKAGKAAMLATRIIPVLFNTISFQVVYAAMNYFALSACQMNVGISIFSNNDSSGNGSGGGDSSSNTIFQINASMLNAADCIAIIVAVPLLDSYIYPKVDNYLGRKCKCSEKYMVGLFIGILAICFAALFEVLRRNSPSVPACHKLQNHNDDVVNGGGGGEGGGDDDGYYADHSACYSMCAAPGIEMSSFSVWWMAIPFFLVGFGKR